MKSDCINFGDVRYQGKDRVASITLNRPERCNAISERMPGDIAAAFEHANDDDAVHVIVLTGAGRGFCGGYDLKTYADSAGANPAIQEMPWDPMIDYRFMSAARAISWPSGAAINRASRARTAMRSPAEATLRCAATSC